MLLNAEMLVVSIYSILSFSILCAVEKVKFSFKYYERQFLQIFSVDGANTVYKEDYLGYE